MSDNPYTPPDASGQPPLPLPDSALLVEVARRMSQARVTAPSLSGVLMRWPGIFQWLLMMGFGLGVLFYIRMQPDFPLSPHWLTAFSGFVAGAALRDIGTTRRIVRLWPAQAFFIDWSRVDDVLKNGPRPQ